MTALNPELLTNLVFDRCISDDGLFGCANSTVIETCACQNIGNGFLDIRCTLNKYGHVSRADAERGLTR